MRWMSFSSILRRLNRPDELDIGAVEKQSLLLELFDAESNAFEPVGAHVYDLELPEQLEALAGRIEFKILNVLAEEREDELAAAPEGEFEVELAGDAVELEAEELACSAETDVDRVHIYGKTHANCSRKRISPE